MTMEMMQFPRNLEWAVSVFSRNRFQNQSVLEKPHWLDFLQEALMQFLYNDHWTRSVVQAWQIFQDICSVRGLVKCEA